MGWKDMAKLASQWADAKRTEMLTADRRTREGAAGQAERVEQDAKGEAVTSFLEQVLPQGLADKVTAARPENVAARQAAADAQAEVERRDRLAAMSDEGATAELTLTISDDQVAAIAEVLPCVRTEENGWFIVRLESPDPIPVGSGSLAELSLAVPGFDGPGRYDLAELARRSESGEMESWDALDMYLNPTGEADDRIAYVDVFGEAPVVIEVGETSLSFDLPMASAVASFRASGTVIWA